jgi:hypothetical protein
LAGYKLHELANLQRFAPVWHAHQRDGFLRALGGANAAAHAPFSVYHGGAIHYRDGPKLAKARASVTANALLRSHLADIAGGGQHRDAITPCLHRPTTAGATITDGVKAAEHGVLEESMVYVAALVLGV